MKNPEALDWYRFARMDFQSAITLDEHSRPKPLEIICYLSEQYVEKMLKGFLVVHSQNPPKTHDLPLLCDMCIEFDKRFSELSEISEFLTLFGVQPRYPNEIEILDEDKNRALRYIQGVMDFFDKYEFITHDIEIVVAPLDVDNFLDFVVAAHRETFNITFRSEITNEFLDKELAGMRENCSNDENSVVGSFVGGELVGLAVLETRSRSDDSKFGWIHFYYVSPQFRRLGVGLRLVGYSVEYFSALGLTEFFLRVGEHNGEAQAFYHSAGFSRIPEGDKTGINGVNELMMKYDIIKSN